MSAFDRFVAKIEVGPADCWLWTAPLTDHGYGRIFVDGKNVKAHRFAYEWFVGPIPDGMVIDHLCRVRHCVNPDHLRAVTPVENREAPGSRATHLSHCKRGHELTDDNVFVRPSNGQRQCRLCHNLKARERHARRKYAIGVEVAP